MEKELNSGTSGTSVADAGPAVRSEVEERHRLVSLVKLQAKEVDALKAEINLLRRKGGHIYIPAAPDVQEMPFESERMPDEYNQMLGEGEDMMPES